MENQKEMGEWFNMKAFWNQYHGWKSRLAFGRNAFALSFVIATMIIGLVGINDGREVLSKMQAFPTIMRVIVPIFMLCILIDLFQLMITYSRDMYLPVVAEELIAMIPFVLGCVVFYVFSQGQNLTEVMELGRYESLWVAFAIAACIMHVICGLVFRVIRLIGQRTVRA